MTRRPLVMPVIGAVILSLGGASWTVMASSTSATAASSSFGLGTTSASAEVLNVPVALAGENIGVNAGLSNAGYTDITGQSESELVSSALSGELPFPLPADLDPLIVSSTGALVSSAQSAAGSAGTGIGNESVAASQSSGLSSTNLSGFSAGTSIVIAGGSALAAGSLVGGDVRQATSSASVGSISLLNGLVVLSGLQWKSAQSTGATTSTSSSFSIASVKVAGVTLPVIASTLSTVFTAVNAALAPTGFHITPPTETINTTGAVSETPLSIGIDHSALGAEVLGPVVTAVQPLRTAIFNSLANVSQETGTGDLVLEVVLGILAGQGNLDLNIGGSFASSNDTTYSNPFGTGSSASVFDSVPTTAPASGANTSSGAFAGGNGLGSPIGSSATPVPTTTPPGSARPGQSTGPVRLASSTSCASTTVGGCRSDSSARTVAIILLAATGLLAVAETLRQRRRQGRLTEAAQPAAGASI